MALHEGQQMIADRFGNRIQENLSDIRSLVRILVNDALDEDDYIRHASSRVSKADEHEIFDIWTPKIQASRHSVDDEQNVTVWINATHEVRDEGEDEDNYSWTVAGVRCMVDLYLEYDADGLVERDVELHFTESLRDRQDGGGYDHQ